MAGKACFGGDEPDFGRAKLFVQKFQFRLMRTMLSSHLIVTSPFVRSTKSIEA